MDILSLKKQIMGNQLGNLYLFTGEEMYVQDVYIKKISEVSGLPVKRIDQVSSIKALKGSFIAHNYVFVCRDDETFIKEEKSWEYTENTLLGDSILIVQLTDLDKRTKFYKKFSDRIISFDLLDEQVLVKHISKITDLSRNNLCYLIKLCGNSYNRVLLELGKIQDFSSFSKIDINSAFDKMLDLGAIYVPPKDAIFDFVNAVLLRNSQSAYGLLKHCQDIEEPALRLIQVLYTNVRRVLQVQSCTSEDIAKSTGLSEWEIKCTKDKLYRWSVDELVEMIFLLRNLEKGIKEGKIDESIAIDYFMVNIFS